ncbi:MAG: DUF4091 domain-containing protein, partial [Marinilabiliales bacterium]|nr:DUF4091 domain-containing protein [Marinilabiliales bacterium]
FNGQNEDLATSLRSEAHNLESQIQLVHPLMEQSISSKEEGNASQGEAIHALVQRAKRDQQMANDIERCLAKEGNTTLLLAEGKLWETRARDFYLSDHAESTLQIKREMVKGETESISIDMTNVLGRTIYAQISTDSIPAGIHLSLHQSVPTADATGQLSWDALPELGESATTQIGPNSTQELFLKLNCSAEVKPGHYHFPILIRALNGNKVQTSAGSPKNVPLPASSVMIDLDLYDFDMASKGAIRLCAWGSYDKASIQDLLDHGNTVFVLPHGKTSKDHLTTDFSEMDKVLDSVLGQDVFILLSGLPNVLTEEDLGKDRPEFNAYLDRLLSHLATKGIDKSHFAMYPYDEPGGAGWTIVNKLVLFGKMTKAKDPDLLIYMDGGGEAPMFQAMAPYLDIWCVGYNALPEQSAAMEVIRKDKGSRLWSYDCSYSYARPMGPNIKNINIIGQFRMSALAAYRWHANGIGYWSYNLGDDIWGRTMMEYPLVYKGHSKPVDSRRWEAVREGTEDFRILVALKDLLGRLSSEKKKILQNRIDELETSINHWIDQSDGEMKLGLSRKVLDVTNSEETVHRIRKELMDCVRLAISLR